MFINSSCVPIFNVLVLLVSLINCCYLYVLRECVNLMYVNEELWYLMWCDWSTKNKLILIVTSMVTGVNVYRLETPYARTSTLIVAELIALVYKKMCLLLNKMGSFAVMHATWYCRKNVIWVIYFFVSPCVLYLFTVLFWTSWLTAHSENYYKTTKQQIPSQWLKC